MKMHITRYYANQSAGWGWALCFSKDPRTIIFWAATLAQIAKAQGDFLRGWDR
jgi:hypothetical protein